jgi:hypothetical protein
MRFISKWQLKHSVSKSKERGRMYHVKRKDKEKWQSIESLAEQLLREKHY